MRLRSTEADVRLGGQLELVKSNTSTRLVSPSGEFVPGLSLTGDLRTTGGTYNLNFGVVQREFNVLPNGTVTFDGTSPETPLVDIRRAVHRQTRPRDRDLGVIVNLVGRLPNPQITFTSDNEYTLDQSDLLSYLIIGQPGFDFANANAATAFISPTVSAILADRLRNTPVSSFVELVPARVRRRRRIRMRAFSSQSFNEYLKTATLDVGFPVPGVKNLFLGVNAGYCQIAKGQIQGLGAKVEYRFRPDISLQAAYDPAAVDTRQSCTESTLTSASCRRRRSSASPSTKRGASDQERRRHCESGVAQRTPARGARAALVRRTRRRVRSDLHRAPGPRRRARVASRAALRRRSSRSAATAL